MTSRFALYRSVVGLTAAALLATGFVGVAVAPAYAGLIPQTNPATITLAATV